jgi:hypothetical protein
LVAWFIKPWEFSVLENHQAIDLNLNILNPVRTVHTKIKSTRQPSPQNICVFGKWQMVQNIYWLTSEIPSPQLSIILSLSLWCMKHESISYLTGNVRGPCMKKWPYDRHFSSRYPIKSMTKANVPNQGRRTKKRIWDPSLLVQVNNTCEKLKTSQMCIIMQQEEMTHRTNEVGRKKHVRIVP